MIYNNLMVKIFPLLVSVMLLLVAATTVLANQSDEHANPPIPERNGDYADPEHPGVRVRVFVHEAKGPLPIISNPVLACTDPDSSAVVGPTGWKLPNGTWTYQLNVGSVPSSVGVGSTNFSTLAGNAFNAWQAAQGKVTFTRGVDTTANRQALDFKNIVSWGRTSGTALAVTYTWYYTATNIVADVDTIMNQKFVWSWTDPAAYQCSLYSNTYDSQDILTHEIGHWMGLNDHKASEYQHNTMYWSGTTGELKKDTLTTGDINGVKAIYP